MPMPRYFFDKPLQLPQIAALLALSLAALPAAAQEVDTSEWICEFCPFESGYRGDYEVGASSVSDDSAFVGDASGYDEEGIYANLSGDGSYARDGYRMRWTLQDLGLDSRSADLRGSEAGRFDYHLAWRELPRRQFNTTATVFENSAGGLSLPSGWVRAPQSSGLLSLDTALRPQNIASDRQQYEVGASYLPGSNWRIAADYRRQQQDGNKMLGGSYYTNAAILPLQIDYATDEVTLGIRYAGERLTMSLGWLLSDFDNGQTDFGWQHPFTTAAGAEFAALAPPPDNRLQQLTLSAGYALPVFNAYASFSAAIGEIEQTEAFLPYTSNTSLLTTPLPASDLAGSVDTNRLAFAFTASPIAKTRIRVSYRYDERDNKTAELLWNRVIADSFVSGEQQANVPYSFQRSTLRASAEYKLLDTLRLSAGYDRKDRDYDFQEIAEQSEDSGWGRIRWRPRQTLQLDVRGGTAERDIGRYNEVFAATLGQNPLLRKYNLAYRFRQFADMTLSYSPTAKPVSFVLNALYADDSYTKSRLGFTSGDELRVNADMNWSLSERSSIYVNAGLEALSSSQFGSAASGEPDWRATHDDDFTTLGAGWLLRDISDKFDLALDYTRSYGQSDIALDSADTGDDRFPQLASEFDYVQMRLRYRQSERLDVIFNLRYQRFRAEDWALEGVAPATIPVILSLGANPYSPEVYIIGVGFRYRLGVL